MKSILNELFYEGPKVFAPKRLADELGLFGSRAALFYTPTGNLPLDMVGSGRLEINLPIPFPTLFEWDENLAYRIPRLWVDLIQRATGKLRWTPLVPAKVTLIRYDSDVYGALNVYGAKALVDALKHQSTGRNDGRLLYYFGAIRDDNNEDLKVLRVEERLVSDPSKAYSQVIVEQASQSEPSDMKVISI